MFGLAQRAAEHLSNIPNIKTQLSPKLRGPTASDDRDPSPPPSPRSLASKAANVLADYYLQLSSEKEKALREVEYNLTQLDREYHLFVSANKDNQPLLQEADKHYESLRYDIQERMKSTLQQIDSAYLSKPKVYEDMNNMIAEAQHVQDKALHHLVKRFRRISIHHKTQSEGLPRPCERNTKPFKYFSDLTAAVSKFFPGFQFNLFVHGTKKEIGSQDELIFAYEDVAEDQTVLELDVDLKQVRKMKRIYEDQQEDNDTIQSDTGILKYGPFDAVEEQQFKQGVRQYGWGSWVRIATLIPGRTREQVRSFARRTDISARYLPQEVAIVSTLQQFASAQSHGIALLNRIHDIENDQSTTTSIEQEISE